MPFASTPAFAVAAAWRGDVPVVPTPPIATDWLREELADPAYRAAQPTVVDLIGRAIADWFASLFQGPFGAPPELLPVLLVAAGAVLVLVALLVFGVPRLRARTRVAAALFGDDDRRSAGDLRRDAADAASRGDWVAAIADRFRALARSVADREVIAVLPGTTAHAFAASAADPFPDERAALAAAADAFDAVRYLERAGDEAQYRAIVGLDDRIAAATPALDGAAAGTATAPGAQAR